jgi:transposase
VISERGKRLKSGVVETNGRALVEFIKTVPGRTHLCLEAGTQSGWLYEVLSPHVDEIVVTHLEQHSRGRKDDETDAFARAEQMRVGAVMPVLKDGGRMGELRAHVDVQEQVTADVVRVQNRLKALYRSRGVSTPGGAVYTQSHRDEYLSKLPKPYRSSALLLHAQLDALQQVKKDADKQLIEQSHEHAISRTLETCPGLGPIRVAQLIATVISPHRFRGARQLWAYSGLGIVMRSSSDWVMTSRRMAEGRAAQDPRSEPQRRPAAQARLQGCRHGRAQPPHGADVQRLPAADRVVCGNAADLKRAEFRALRNLPRARSRMPG